MNVQLAAEKRENALMLRVGQAALVTITLSLIHGCATTRVEQNRQAITGIAADEAMVILGRATYNDRQTEESFTDCLEDILSGGERPIRLVPQQEFIDQMYPWFEPRTAPGSASDLGQLFTVPGVQAKIADCLSERTRRVRGVPGAAGRPVAVVAGHQLLGGNPVRARQGVSCRSVRCARLQSIRVQGVWRYRQ